MAKQRMIAALVFTALLLSGARAVAVETSGEPTDLARLAGFVRWSGALVSLLVVVGAAILLRFVSAVAERLAATFASRRLAIQKMESFVRFFIYVGAGAAVISLSFRVNQTVLTVIGGTLAVAVGFAMRDLMAAVVAGVTIMFDRPFQVGDRVEYAGQYGDITRIGLRSVRMQTLDDNVVTIPNNKILTDVTSSGNWGALEMQVKMEFFVGLDQDVDLASRLVKEALLTSRFVYLDRPVFVLLKQVIRDAYVAMQITGRAYVLDTKYEKAFETDVNRRVNRAFRQHGVLPPAMLVRSPEGASALAALRPGQPAW
jgi:small-conductance mechanosensitive channel